MARVYNKRGTRANLNTLAAGNGLAAGEIYLISDENRLAVGLSANTYETYAKQSESGGGGGYTPAWYGEIAATRGDGDPNTAMGVPRAPIAPNSIGASTALLAYFRLAGDIIVDTIKAFGFAATTGIFKAAIYKASDLSRLTAELTFNTTAGGIDIIATGLNLTLAADELYIAALTVTSGASGLAAIYCIDSRLAWGVSPEGYSGKMDLNNGFIKNGTAKATISGGTLPATLGTPAAPAAATFYSPLFIMESA